MPAKTMDLTPELTARVARAVADPVPSPGAELAAGQRTNLEETMVDEPPSSRRPALRVA